MKIYTTMFLMLGLFAQLNFAQTTVFSDDFSTNTNDTWTTSGLIGSSAWSVIRSGDDWGARRNTSPEQLELTNDVGATANANGWVFANVSTSSFSSPYNTALNLNTGIITWNFNMRQIRPEPAGFTGGSYGVAFILAGSSQFADYEGNGYAVVLGQSGTTDPIRLVRYSEGLSSTLTNIITSNTSGLSDFGADYLSIKVTYNPLSDEWELFLRNDGASAFADPNTGNLTSQGTAIDNYSVGSQLLYMGGYWHGSTAANQPAFFDNVSISIGTNITTSIISLSNAFLSGFNYAQGSGPSAEQSFNISGRNLTDNILISPPTNYEISITSGGPFTSSSITLTQSGGIVSSTAIYVRLKAELITGTFNNESIIASSNSAFNKTVICNGSVTPAVSPPLPLVEDFNYTPGDLLTNNGWTLHSGTTDPIIVSNSGLTYSGYPSSGIGNAANVFGAGEDVNLGFAAQSVNGTTIYFSALVNVTETANDLIGEYFLHLGDRLTPTSFSFFCARVFARVDISGNVNFGLSNNSTTNWITNDYSKNTTYLLIVKYIINTSGNDEVKMWVRSSGVPVDENAAGAADITISNQDGQSVIDAIGIRQVAGIPDLVIDGIRVATSWSNAPLPVELSSFSASIASNNVKLRWETETEVNNYGFEIHRQIHTSTPLSVTGWEKIGFVNGNGNSNSPKSYSFVDDKVSSGKYSYKLKQIDNDGQFEYSKAIEVDFGAPKKFELSQNYPNPFNPATTIRYNLPEAGMVKLTLFNILGQELRTLVNEFKEAGVHTINFSATGGAIELNSGMYIYKIEAGNFVQTRKMTLVK